MDMKNDKLLEAKYTIYMKILRTLSLLLAALAIVGCIESSRPTATGKGNIRGLNAAVTTPDLLFLMEERFIGTTPYKSSTATREFDGLDYMVNFDYQFAGDLLSSRVISIPFTLVKDTDYLFIFTGSLDAPETLTWERPIRVWDGSEAIMDIRFGHLSPQLGEVDFYFAAPGTVPVLGDAQATLTFGNHAPVKEFPGGEYEFIITSKDNPADVLFQSVTITFQPQFTYDIAAFDPDPSITSPLGVRLITGGGASAELVDVNASPVLRTFHGSFTTGPYDLYRDADFSAPWIANVAYAEISGGVDTPPDEVTYTFTDAGNAGSILHEEDFDILNGRRTTAFLMGTATDLAVVELIDDTRPLDDVAKLRFVQASTDQAVVDIYMVESGNDIADLPPRFVLLPFQANTSYTGFEAKDYDIYVTEPAAKDVLAGPFPFTGSIGDVVHFAIVDTADPNVLEIVKYDHLTVAP